MDAKSALKASLGLTLVLVVTPAMGQVPFPPNGPGAPVGRARQAVFPYPGQCTTTPGFAGLPLCTAARARSFACEPSGSGFSNQTGAAWHACGTVTSPSRPSLMDPTQQAKFQFELLNPLDYQPDTTRFANADYYEIAVHEAWGFQAVASAGLFPDPTKLACGAAACPPVPDGMQWTGLRCATPDGCSCPAELAPTFRGSYCSARGKVPYGAPLYTPIWGVGQLNMSGGPVTGALRSAGLFQAASRRPEWSRNDFVATWPSISIRGTRGRPVVVKWVNQFPNNHLFCPHPEAADWPCAIDRTFMGVKATVDPATAPFTFQLAGIPYDGVNPFGGPQQPDNSWVTHLHGGEIPPQTDGFAEKWFGNVRTGRYYSPQPWLLNPAFGAPPGALEAKQVGLQYGAIFRPGGDPALSLFQGESSWMYDTYAYPMVNEEATIWFHDHTLAKTHHNVIAGPAGFFPVKDPARHGKVVNGECAARPSTGAPFPCEFTWLDPVTEPRDALGAPLYDLFLAVQDRSFNDDGTLDFPNNMNVPLPPPSVMPVASPLPAKGGLQDPGLFPNCLQTGSCLAPGTTPVTPGPNPQVHPVWVPEYFADHALVNGVLWPKRTVAPGWYRIRIVDGSDARCYNFTLGTQAGLGGRGAPAFQGLAPQAPGEHDVRFLVIATEQGYLPHAVATDHVTMCPGERYELLVDFAPHAGRSLYLNNDAAAPYPDGLAPQDPTPGNPFTELATIMRFDVTATGVAPVPTCGRGGAPARLSWDPARTPAQNGLGCIDVPPTLVKDFASVRDVPVAAERVLYLNEKIDGVTGASLGLQIDGVPFEYDVTETPRKGTWEMWHVVNTTGDAHPIHPHLGRFQIVKRERIDVGCYLTLLCGAPDCQPGPAPGGMPVLTPDYRACLTPQDPSPFGKPDGSPWDEEAGWKDAMRAYPGEVLTFVGKWDGSWNPQVKRPNAPGAGNGANPGFTPYPVGAQSPRDATTWTWPEVTQGPYVWHCHINSHEDSEMMRSSLVVSDAAP